MTQVCEGCETVFYPNRPNQQLSLENHDCLELLKAKVHAQLKEAESMKWQLGTHEKINVKCPKSDKRLSVHHGTLPKYQRRNAQTRVICSTCGRKGLEDFDFFYACFEKGCKCDFDLCRICALR